MYRSGILRLSAYEYIAVGVRVLVKEELCEDVVEIRMMSDRVMSIVLPFKEEVGMEAYWYASQISWILE